jgi:hypothetical protein
MKTKVLISFLLIAISVSVMAQGVENDDMYFNSKDRAKLNALRGNDVDTYSVSAKGSRKAADENASNPTDSYSARNVNPEYAARSNAQTAQTDNADYFTPNYQYSTARNLNNWNNNFNNWYVNPWYSYNYYGPSINAWNSPYYGYYNAGYSPWYDPYWNYNGWSTSFSYYWGNSWNYGWGGNYNYWNRPYYMNSWSSMWGPSFGGYYGYGYGYGSWYGAPNVILVNNNYTDNQGRHVTTGHRPSRSTWLANQSTTSHNRTRSDNGVTISNNRPTNSGGRSATTRQEDYYNRSWRYSAPSNSNSGYGNGGNVNHSRFNSNSDPFNYPSHNSYNNYNNHNNSFNSGRGSYDGGTRSYTPSSGGGTHGRTRGRD